MKKFLMIAVLVAMVAAPAFAGLAPEYVGSGAPSNMVNYSLGSSASRSTGYVPNDPNHLYDNWVTFYAGSPPVLNPTPGLDGPEPSAYRVTQNIASGAFWNNMQLKPGATSQVITNMHLLIENRSTTPGTVTFCFANDVGGAFPVGAFMLTTASNSTACFFLAGMAAGPILYNVDTLLPAGVHVTQRDIWMGIQSRNINFAIRTGFESSIPLQHQVNGNIGDNGGPARYIGAGDGAWASGGGATIFSHSSISSFHFGTAPNQLVGNMFLALGTTPEPATAALLMLGGLFALRRRKVKA